MTQITTIHGRFKTLLASTLSSYKRLPFPYLLDKNPLYDKAYGIVIGPASRPAEDDILGCSSRILKRTIAVPMYNQASFSLGDTDQVESGVLAITEDFVSLYKAVESDGDLNGGGSPPAAISTYYTNDSGIQFAEVSRGTVAAVIVNFDVTYRETVP